MTDEKNNTVDMMKPEDRIRVLERQLREANGEIARLRNGIMGVVLQCKAVVGG